MSVNFGFLPCSTLSISSCAFPKAIGFWLRRYAVHVKTEPVVSWPATSIDRRSSRSWILETSSRLASKNRRILGSDSFTYSSPSSCSPSASTIALHFVISSSTVSLIRATAFAAFLCLGIIQHRKLICQ
eukprot:Gb_11859 [translate_table: standard]